MPRRRKGAGDTRPKRAAPPPGLPDPASVVSEGEIVSPKGARYRVLRTTETDPYDRPAPAAPKRARGRKAPPRSEG